MKEFEFQVLKSIWGTNQHGSTYKLHTNDIQSKNRLETRKLTRWVIWIINKTNKCIFLINWQLCRNSKDWIFIKPVMYKH